MPPNPHYESTKGLLPVLLDAGDTSQTRMDNSIDNGDLSETLEPQPSWMCPQVEELLSLDLFGWRPNPATKYIPLVDCWLDLEEHLSESTIPSPVDLWTEQQRIGAIINAAIERRNASRTAGATQAPLAPASPSTTPETRQPPKKSKWRKLFVEIVSSGLVTLTKLSKVILTLRFSTTFRQWGIALFTRRASSN
ncbi:hypothetical protein GSI_04304 [Ganoderma sinense ZZ0214-1]|uniref:Uncharacterized protein n=1 Tax=Ganoderma sinense ZZ0214-1 TaxID=1077348 RepID=A0A2G8SIV7_9APHY|nr:hypothetical protein GSI_04304 [Ganoderma sinense ZZ0214-1]